MDTIMETLPDQDLMVGQMTVSFGLSNQPADEVFINQFPMKLFTDSKPLNVQRQFVADVEKIGKEIRKR